MPESASSRFLSTVEGDVFMMQKGQHDQSKVNVAYSYASEQGLQQKAAAPNPPAETQLADPLSFMAKARWFALGLLGGIFAMIVKLAFPTKMSFEQRKQSEWAVWAGFAVNTLLLVVLINTGCLDMLIAGLSGTAAGPAYVSPAFG